MLHVDVRVLWDQGVLLHLIDIQFFLQSLLFTYCSILAMAMALVSCAFQGLPSSTDEKGALLRQRRPRPSCRAKRGLYWRSFVIHVLLLFHTSEITLLGERKGLRVHKFPLRVLRTSQSQQKGQPHPHQEPQAHPTQQHSKEPQAHPTEQQSHTPKFRLA